MAPDDRPKPRSSVLFRRDEEAQFPLRNAVHAASTLVHGACPSYISRMRSGGQLEVRIPRHVSN
jgi:hypothetical protein